MQTTGILWPSKKAGTLVVMLSLAYLWITSLLVGLRYEHWLTIILYNIFFFISPKSRKITLAFALFLVFAMLYDLMKAFPNYLVNHVDISGLYHLEQNIFGFALNGSLLTPNEFFAQYHTSFLDILSGLFYINWIPVPLAFALYLYITNKQQFLHFSLTFFLVNLLGFCLYYVHPAAPPWYVALYGFDLHLGVPGNTAGLGRFDTLVQFPVFHSIYARNSNVFAAMPSLHSAYPVVVLFYGIKNKLGWVNVLLALFMAGIWFAAIYSGHHYVLDIIAGIFCALTGIIIFEKGILKLQVTSNIIRQYEKIIT